MKNRLLVLTLLVIIGGGAWVGLRWYTERQVFSPPPSEREMGKLISQRFGSLPTEPQIEAAAVLDDNHAIRLAVGGVGLADEIQNREIADIIQADLRDAPGLELVDRQSLDKVIKEMGMSLSGLVRAADSIKVGRLLKADWFLFGSTVTFSNGTRAVLSRIVDTRTGSMRDIGVIASGADRVQLASELAKFVRRCRENKAKTKADVFVAVGAFGDVGVNNRQANFPAQLNAYLLKAYRRGPFRLLEREQVEALLHEVRLDLAGLTDEPTKAVAPFQSAFWTIDGFYQSVEGTDHQVEVSLQVSRAFGKTSWFTIHGIPEEALRQIKQRIDMTITNASARILAPTRRGEIQQQLTMGADLFRLATRTHDPIPMLPGFMFWMQPQDGGKYERNLNEAKRALRTVLVLDHQNHAAKWYLAACAIYQTEVDVEEAKGLLREIAESAPEDSWCDSARESLGRLYQSEHKFREGKRWFEEAARHSKDPKKIAFYQAQAQELEGRAIALEGSVNGTGPVDEASKAFFQNRVLIAIRGEENSLKGLGGGLDDSLGLAGFVEAYGNNKAAAAKGLMDLLPMLRKEFPDSMPHLMSAILSYQVDTNSPALGLFRETLQVCREHPQRLLRPDHFFEVVMRGPYDWCMGNKLYELAAEIGEAKRDAAAKDSRVAFGRTDQVQIGFAYAKLLRWQDALNIFAGIGDEPVLMDHDGPWGGVVIPFLPGRAAAFCREKLGLPPAQLAGRFEFGKPCLCLHTPSAFSVTDSGLWVAIGGELLQLDLDLKTNRQEELPISRETGIQAMCVGPEQVWVGTTGEGLVEYEPPAGKFRHFVESDGLLLDYVSTLSLNDQTLWIGFARNRSGGVARMDVQRKQLMAFTPSLSADPLNGSGTSEGPPRDEVSCLATDPQGGLWTLAPSGGLRKHSPADNAWKFFRTDNGAKVTCISAGKDRLFGGFSLQLARIKMAVDTTEKQTNSAGFVERIVTQEELARMRKDPKLWGRYLGSSGGQPLRGDLRWRDFDHEEWHSLSENLDLPAPPDCIKAAGSEVWVGGFGYVAVVDLNRKVIRKLSRVPARNVDQLEVGGGYIWAKFDRHLYRAPLSATF